MPMKFCNLARLESVRGFEGERLAFRCIPDKSLNDMIMKAAG